MTLAILVFSFLSLFLTKNTRINTLSFAFLLYAFSIYLLELNIIKIRQLSFYTKLFMFACYFMLIVGAFIGSNFKHKTLMRSKINLTVEKKIFLYSITISLISILLNTFYMIKSTSGFLDFFIRYNELYGKFGRNLNKLLAWLHGRSLVEALGVKKPRWGLLDQFSKTEIVVVKCVNQGAHRLNRLAKAFTEILEMTRGYIA